MNFRKLVTIMFAIIIIGGIAAFAVLSLGTARKDSADMPMNKSVSSSNAMKPAENEVVIADYKFNPSPIKVKAGTTVTWINTDIARHNIVSDSGTSADVPSSALLDKGARYSFTFTAAGTYKYHCEPHPYMKGSVEVTQ